MINDYKRSGTVYNDQERRGTVRDDEGLWCHDDGLWAMLAKNGNGNGNGTVTVTGQNEFERIFSFISIKYK
jgi:hypothetical protein